MLQEFQARDVAIGDQRFDVREQTGIALAAVEQRHLVAAVVQLTYEVRADEARAAEDQHLQRFRAGALRPGALLQQQSGRRGSSHLHQISSVHVSDLIAEFVQSEQGWSRRDRA